MEVNSISQGRHITTLSGNLEGNLDLAIPQSTTTEINIPKGENKELSTRDRDYTVDDIKKSVDKLNKLFEDKSTYVEYEVYGKSKSVTIKILDHKTKEVIKEIPPKKLIDMVDKLCELAGVFIDQKA